jgi:hypothetical protein
MRSLLSKVDDAPLALKNFSEFLSIMHIQNLVDIKSFPSITAQCDDAETEAGGNDDSEIEILTWKGDTFASNTLKVMKFVLNNIAALTKGQEKFHEIG